MLALDAHSFVSMFLITARGRRGCLCVPCLPIILSIVTPHVSDYMWQTFYLWYYRDIVPFF